MGVVGCATEDIDVTSGALASQVNYHWLTSTRKEERSVFSPTDEKVVLSVRFDINYRASYEWYKVEWIDPTGRPYKVVSTRTEFGSHRDLKAELAIRGKMAATLPGVWRVRLSLLGRGEEPNRVLISRLFRIEAMTPAMQRTERVDAPSAGSRPLAGDRPGGVAAAADDAVAELNPLSAQATTAAQPTIAVPATTRSTPSIPDAPPAAPAPDAEPAPSTPTASASPAAPLNVPPVAAPEAPTSAAAPPGASEVSSGVASTDAQDGSQLSASSVPALPSATEAAPGSGDAAALSENAAPALPNSADAQDESQVSASSVLALPSATAAAAGSDDTVPSDASAATSPAVGARAGSQQVLPVRRPGAQPAWQRRWPACPPLYYSAGPDCVEQAPEE